FLERGIGEAAVDLLICSPIFRAENRAGGRGMAERPDAFISEALVVALFFLGAEPHTAQRITRMIGRNAKVVVCIDRLAVGVAGAVSDPGAVGGDQDRLERGDHAAGW